MPGVGSAYVIDDPAQRCKDLIDWAASKIFLCLEFCLRRTQFGLDVMTLWIEGFSTSNHVKE